MNCRSCGGLTNPVLDRADVILRRCTHCELVCGWPASGEEHASYDDHYARSVPPSAPVARYSEWLQVAERRIGRGRLIEIGAGAGGFARTAASRGWLVQATEVADSALARLRELPIGVLPGALEDACLPAGHFDLAVSLEVLEHLPSPSEHLNEVSRITRPGGLLLLTTPNFDGLTRRLCGARWRVISAEHLTYFTPETLSAIILGAGFRHVHVASRALDTAVWFAAHLPGRASLDPVASAVVRDRVASSRAMRSLREIAHRLLAFSRLGDTLLAWAEK